ncbi:MAG TPA: phosphoribosylanthranilate isomerase [Bryobacteraceae bacterium]|nr:phosphoribosylanthranilate isomerase [Bryobacteraceae bacterium]
MIVKICGLTNREDALAAAEVGATALGFNFFAGSPRYVRPEAAARIIEELPPSVWTVGVWVNEDPEQILALSVSHGIQVAQLHGDEGPDSVPSGIRVWKAVRMGAASGKIDRESRQVEALVLDTAAAGLYGGTGQTFDWSIARSVPGKVILAGGLDASNVREAIRTAKPWGVDAASRLEIAPGRKDHVKMSEFIKAALEETE